MKPIDKHAMPKCLWNGSSAEVNLIEEFSSCQAGVIDIILMDSEMDIIYNLFVI